MYEQEFPSPRRWSVRPCAMWLFLAVLVLGGCQPAEDADPFGDPGNKGESETSPWLQWSNWRPRVVVVVVAVLIAYLVTLRLLFKALLNKRKPTWPRTAFGIAGSLFLLLVTVVLIFTLGTYFADDSGELWGEYGVSGIILVVGLILAGLVFGLNRSPHGREAPV